MASSVGFRFFENGDNFCVVMKHLPPPDFFSCSKVCKVWRSTYYHIESFIMKPHHEKAELYVKGDKYSYKSWFVLNKTIKNGHPKTFYLKYLGVPIGRPETTVQQIDLLGWIDYDSSYESSYRCELRNFETYPAVFLYEAVRRPIRKTEFLFLDEKAKLELTETGRVREGKIAISNSSEEKSFSGPKRGNPEDGLKLVRDVSEIEVALSPYNLAVLLNFPLSNPHADIPGYPNGFDVISYIMYSESDYFGLVFLPCILNSSVEFVRRKVPLLSFNQTRKEQVHRFLLAGKGIASTLSLLLLHGFERMETGKCMLDERPIPPELAEEVGDDMCVVYSRTPEIQHFAKERSRSIVVGGGSRSNSAIDVSAEGDWDEEDEDTFDEVDEHERDITVDEHVRDITVDEHVRKINIGASPCIDARPNYSAMWQIYQDLTLASIPGRLISPYLFKIFSPPEKGDH
jgi:hypothetical protein